MALPLQFTVYETGAASVGETSWEELCAAAPNDTIRDAVKHLSQFAGGRGLKRSVPLAMTLWATIQGVAPQCIRLLDLLFTLENQVHLRSVAKGLRKAGTEYLHTVTVLETAAAAVKRKCETSIEPPGGNGSLADLQVNRIRLEVTCRITPPREALEMMHMMALQMLGDVGLAANDVTFDIYAETVPQHAAANLVEAARRARFSPGCRVHAEGVGFAEYTPGRGSSSWPDRGRPLSVRVVNALKRKLPQIAGHSGPRVVLVRVDRANDRDPEHELCFIADYLLKRMMERNTISACLLLADVFYPWHWSRCIAHPRYRAWCGATAFQTYRLAALFPNPVARYPLVEEECELFVGERGLFDESR